LYYKKNNRGGLHEKKCFLFLPFSFLFLLFTLTNAFAAETTSKFSLLFDEELDKPYVLKHETGEKVYEAFEIDSSGQKIDIPLDEYIIRQESALTIEESQENDLENTLNENIIATSFSPDYFVKIRYGGQDGNTKVNGTRLKVTADLRGPATVSVVETKTFTESFSGTYGYALGEEIKYNASFQWVKSVANAKSLSYSLKIDSGKIGYIAFTPYINKTWGKSYIDTYNMVNQRIKSEYAGLVYGYSPKKTDFGFADGLYEVVQK